MSALTPQAQFEHWLQLAESHLLLDQLKLAEKYLRKASRVEPAHRRVLLGLAQVAWKRGRWQEAIQNLEYTLKIDAHFLPALLLLAQIYLARRQPLRARPLLERGYDLQADHPGIIQALVEVHLQLQQWEQARFFAELLCRLQPQATISWQLLQQVARAQGDILCWSQAAEQIVVLDPEQSQAGIPLSELQTHWEQLEQHIAKKAILDLPALSEQELQTQFERLEQAYGQKRVKHG